MNKCRRFHFLAVSCVLLGLLCACSTESRNSEFSDNQPSLSTVEMEDNKISDDVDDGYMAVNQDEEYDEDNEDEDEADEDNEDEDGFPIRRNNKKTSPITKKSSAVTQATTARNYSVSSKPAVVSFGQLELPSSFATYQLYDPTAKLSVLSLKVPRNWLARSEVRWGQFGYSLAIYEALFRDPKSGITMSLNSGICAQGAGSWKQAALYTNPRKLGQIFIKDLNRFGFKENIKLISASLKELDSKRTQMIRRMSAGQAQPLIKEFVAKYEFTKNGRPWESTMTACLFLDDIQFAFGPKMHSEGLFDIISCTSPKSEAGKAVKICRQIMSSAVNNPQWQQYLAQATNAASARQNAQFQQQQQAYRQNQQDISDMLSDSYNKRSASQDRTSQGWSEAIRGQSSHSNPYNPSSNVETSNRYNHAWVNRSGDVVNTDNSNFNPNVSPSYNGDWTQIK
ncbi:MAG: hypothetical protein ACI376_07465 [Candidatus Bruticola sp.]